MMIRCVLATAALLALVSGCSSARSPDQMWTEAAAEWTKSGATAEERLQDYQECQQEGVDASTRSGRFDYGRYGRRESRRFRRLGAGDLSRRATKRYSVLERCMAERGWSPTAADEGQ
jgi:hypothetical protein